MSTAYNGGITLAIQYTQSVDCEHSHSDLLSAAMGNGSTIQTYDSIKGAYA